MISKRRVKKKREKEEKKRSKKEKNEGHTPSLFMTQKLPFLPPVPLLSQIFPLVKE